MTCRKCGAAAAPTDALCLECGEHLLRHTPMPPMVAPASMPSPNSRFEPTNAQAGPPTALPLNSRQAPTPVLSGPPADWAMPTTLAATDEAGALGESEPTWEQRSRERASRYEAERLERSVEVTPRNAPPAPSFALNMDPAPSVDASETAVPIAPRRTLPKRRRDDEEASRCPGCGTLFSTEPSRCRVCGAPYRPLR